MNERARAARFKALRDDEAFQEVMQEIRDGQSAVFLDSEATQDNLARAHGIIRALAEIDRVIAAAIGAVAMLDKKEGQHRERND